MGNNICGRSYVFGFTMRGANEQRIALFAAAIRAPAGHIVVMPVVDRECKISIGDHGELASDGMGRFRSSLCR